MVARLAEGFLGEGVGTWE